MFRSAVWLRGILRGFAGSAELSIPYGLLLFLVSAALLVRSLLDSWSFPWYSNPDQDLVFLRDGLRIFNGEYPLYADHPGLVQMLVAWFSIFSLNGLGFLPDGSTVAPSDSEWQLIFLVAKSVNVACVASLLFLCALLMTPWIGRLGSLIWVASVSMSMAAVSEVYQLRNELFSSLFLLLGMLIAVSSFSACNEGRACGVGSASVLRGLSAFASAGICLFCFVVSLLAKVQTIPVLVVFSGGLTLFVCISLGLRSRRLYLYVLLGLLASIGLGFLPVLSPEVVGFQAVLLAWAVAAPSAGVIYGSFAQSGRIKPSGVFCAVAAFSLSSLLFYCLARFLADVGWLSLLLNPLSVRLYAVSSSSCESGPLACMAIQGFSGLSYLFERSVDSYLFSPVVGMLIVAGSVYVLFLGGSYSRARANRLSGSRLMTFCGVGCLWVSFLMAFIAGQRWAVDHYLPYQQPFLIAGLILLVVARAPLAVLWRASLVVVSFSVLLMWTRYPMYSRATYLKEDIRLGSISEATGDGSLCASQHAGEEWRSSSLWRLCDGFSGVEKHIKALR